MNISVDDFKKLDIRIGTVVEAMLVEGSEKLLKLKVDFGSLSSVDETLSLIQKSNSDTNKDVRQILSGIAKFYSPHDLIGKQFPFIVNLEPRKMMGLESCGMILATTAEDGSIALLSPNKKVNSGSSIK